MEDNRKFNNFDLLRFLFAATVAVCHAAILSKLAIFVWLWEYLSASVAVDSFFVISGFLIFRSFDFSHSLTSYLGKRVRRIFPGYAAVVVLCGILFFFVSSKGLSGYFNSELLEYIFFNLLTLNFLQPTLPGVFEESALHFVNASLWTIKVEVMFYLSVPIISFLISKINKVFAILVIYIGSIVYSVTMAELSLSSNQEIFLTLEKQLPGQLAYFISGAAIYYFFDSFYKTAIPLFIASVVVLFLHKYLIDLSFLYPAALAVIVIFFAYKFKYLGNFGKYGDFSFGIYIWHFPIIQLLGHFNLFSNQLLGTLLLLVSVGSMAFLSWHLIEKKFLAKSSHYIIVGKN